MSEVSKAKKVMGILGILVALGAIFCGSIIVITAQSTVMMTSKMIDMRDGITTMIDYTCDTCGLTGSIAEGTSDTRDGTECGYISGQAVRCKGHYTTSKREMTEAEKDELNQDIANWEKMKAKASPMTTTGVLAIIAGFLMIVGAVGCFKNQLWGLVVIGGTFIAAIVCIAIGISTILKTYSG